VNIKQSSMLDLDNNNMSLQDYVILALWYRIFLPQKCDC